MYEIILITLRYFFTILLILNSVYLIFKMLETFEFYRAPFFLKMTSIIYLLLSPIYEMIDKIIKWTIFSEGKFYKTFQVIALPFIAALILSQIMIFIYRFI